MHFQQYDYIDDYMYFIVKCVYYFKYKYLVLYFIFFSFLIQGFGMLLMEEAERIAREEHGSNKIAVISGTFHN